MGKIYLCLLTVALILVAALGPSAAERKQPVNTVRPVPQRTRPDTRVPQPDTAANTVLTSEQQPGSSQATSVVWEVIAGGGSDAVGGSYSISGTLGQAIVGPVEGSTFEVHQGFWQHFSCCEGVTGNVNMTSIVDLTDLSMLIGYLTLSPRPTLPCPEEANVNGASIIDLTDLSMLIGYLTLSPRPVLPNCP